MLLGNLLALRQVQVKRLLAFSSLSHMGYILLGLGLAVTFGSMNGAQGAFFHLLNHGLMKGLAFLAAGTLLYVLFAGRGSHAALNRSDLAGAATRYPIVTFTLSIALLALGGLPPFSGFMSKWQIFLAGFQTQNAWAMAAVLFAALNSVLSLGYYAPLINLMYRRQPSEAVQAGLPVPVRMVIPLVVMAAAVVLLGVLPSLANGLTLPAGKALLAIPGTLVQQGLGY
jgi:formate hydrogenlyase subunit 3/multisubunit Na+/H+ antiporter MnhD subunit